MRLGVRMAVNRSFGLGALFLFFVISVALLPLVRNFIQSLTSEGYQTLYPAESSLQASVENNTVGSPNTDTVRVTPDVHTDPTLGYDSRTRDTSLPCNVDAQGQVCPEGTFCDGSTRSCIRINSANLQGEVTGYYS